MKSPARQMTPGEVRDQFLAHVWHTIRYWQRLDDSSAIRIEGAVFSVLAALDGSAATLPGFVVAPAPHPSDKHYCRERGENYFPDAPNVECDIAGRLHDLFYAKAKEIP